MKSTKGPLAPEWIERLRVMMQNRHSSHVARELNVANNTVERALAGLPMNLTTRSYLEMRLRELAATQAAA